MAGFSGPPPNPQRQRRNVDTLGGFRILKNDGVLRGPELDQGRNWNSKTLVWWNEWRRSPLAQVMRDTDWSVMEKAALIYDQIWTTQVWAKQTDLANLSRELDRITGNYGATYSDRLKLRLIIEDFDPQSDIEAAKAKKDTYYEDLLGA